MNRLTKPQLAAVLLLTDGFALLCIKDCVSLLTLAGFLAGTLIQALAVLLLTRSSRPCGRICLCVILLCLLVQGGQSFDMLRRTCSGITAPANGTAVVLLTALVSLYAVSSGIRPLSRAAVFAAAAGALCLAAVTLTELFSAGAGDWEAVKDIPACYTFREEVVRGLAAGTGTGAFAVLYPLAPEGSWKAWLAGRAVVTAAVFFTVILSVGGIMSIVSCQAVTAAHIVQPFPTQRIDALFMTVFTVSAFFAVSIQGVCCTHILGRLVPSLRYRSFTAVPALLVSGVIVGSGLPESFLAAVSLLPLLAPPVSALVSRISRPS